LLLSFRLPVSILQKTLFFRFRAKATDFVFSEAPRKTLRPTRRPIQRIAETRFPKKDGLPEKLTTEHQLVPRLRTSEQYMHYAASTGQLYFYLHLILIYILSTHFFPICIYFHPTFNFQSPTFCTLLPFSVLRHPPIHFLFPVVYFINL
jgi:hypothetical protein